MVPQHDYVPINNANKDIILLITTTLSVFEVNQYGIYEILRIWLLFITKYRSSLFSLICIKVPINWYANLTQYTIVLDSTLHVHVPTHSLTHSPTHSLTHLLSYFSTTNFLMLNTYKSIGIHMKDVLLTINVPLSNTLYTDLYNVSLFSIFSAYLNHSKWHIGNAY